MIRILLLMLLIIGSASAGVYRYQDSKGDMVYTYQPRVGEKQTVDLPESTIATTSKVIPKPDEKKTSSTPAEKVITYETFQLVTPSNQQTFHNQRTIPMTITLTPVLQKGDKINIVLDGQPYTSLEGKDKPEKGNYTIDLKNIDRGSHQLQALLINKEGKQLMSTKSVTIYIHYKHIGTLGN